jgi:hypothetical protein
MYIGHQAHRIVVGPKCLGIWGLTLEIENVQADVQMLVTVEHGQVCFRDNIGT